MTDVPNWRATNEAFCNRLEERGHALCRTKPIAGGGITVELETCLCDRATTDGACFVQRFPNGNVHAGCHHNTCELRGADNKAAWLLEKIAPGESLAARPSTARTSTDARDDFDPKPPPPLPWIAFPLDTLPEEAARYIDASARAIGCDPALIALPVLGVLSAAVGSTSVLRIKGSWQEPAPLWTVTIAPSGSAKSPALEAALYPVFKREAEAAAAYEEAMATYAAAVEAYKALPKGERADVGRPVRPVRRRYRVADTTIESLMLVLADNPRGVLAARDELAGWLGSFDRYARGDADLQLWIEMHGCRRIVVDRKSNTDRPVLYVPRPAVPVVGTVQPGVVTQKLGEQHFASGFAMRLLMTMPPILPRVWTDDDVDHGRRDAYDELVGRLYELEADADGEPRQTVLKREAKPLWVAFYNDNNRRLQALPETSPLRSALAKLEATAARLALILHLSEKVQGRSRTLSADTMQQAIRLTEWLRYETVRLYQRLGFHRRAQSREDKILAALPSPFRWQDLKDAARVERSRAFELIQDWIARQMIERVGHGTYAVRTQRTVDFPDYADFLPAEHRAESGKSAQSGRPVIQRSSPG